MRLARSPVEDGVHRTHTFNANAGPIRNAEMVALGAEMCLAFHRAIAASRGTKDCARRALAAGIPTYPDWDGEGGAEAAEGGGCEVGVSVATYAMGLGGFGVFFTDRCRGIGRLGRIAAVGAHSTHPHFPQTAQLNEYRTVVREKNSKAGLGGYWGHWL